MKRSTLLLAVAALAAAACAPPETATDPAADRDAIEATTATWAEAFNAGDAAAVAALYAENATIYPPGAPPVTGRPAIQDFWQGLIDEGLTAELAAEEVGVDGDLAYKIGSFTVLGPGGDTVDQGHFLEVWTRVGDRWVFHRDIWNSDLPPAPTGEATPEAEAPEGA